MEDWKQNRLVDLLDKLIDYRGKTPKKVDCGIPLITAKIVKNGRIDTPTEFLPIEDYDTWMVRGLPQIGDIVLTTEAPLGEVAQLKDSKIALAQRIVCLRGKHNILDNTYLKYFLMSNIGQSRLRARESGTTVSGIKQSELKEVLIDYPNYDTQHRIASILSSLDDKISVNKKICENLEAQAQALFKNWFIDFAPFKDGKFVESELGMIPEGWRVTNLFEIAEIHDKKRKPLSAMQRSSMEKIFPYYGATELMDYVDNYIFDGDYVLMGEDGSVVREDGTPFIQYVSGKFWVNNHAHVLSGKNGFSTEMLIPFLKKYKIKGLVTGAVQAKLSQTNMAHIKIAIPPRENLMSINEVIRSIYLRIKHCKLESSRLSTLRDTLLPRLMSGQIKL